MFNPSKILLSVLFLLFTIVQVNAQKACCTGKAKANCVTAATASDQQSAQKSCCTKTAKESTSGCTPSQCRGAKTKFGEAKVISELRSNLIDLKSMMENYKDHKFSNQAITVHDIVGETDDESLDIVANHLAIIESEIYAFANKEAPSLIVPTNKANQVKNLQERIITARHFL